MHVSQCFHDHIYVPCIPPQPGGGNRIQDMMIEAGIKPAPFIPVSDDVLQLEVTRMLSCVPEDILALGLLP